MIPLEIERVEAEIVDYKPSSPEPTIRVVTEDELPTNAVRAPVPDDLLRRGRGPRRKYADPLQMQEAIDQYFAKCVRMTVNERTGETDLFWVDPPTIPGLARSLGLTVKTVLEYQKLDEFADIISDAKLIIEEYTAKALIANPKATGLIFILKNMGWQDNRTVTYAPPNRLEAAKTPEQLAELIQQDIVD
ncbi:MAG: hypothetical protein IKU94_06810 [Bacteroidaceae bacterium]|nr:hypothetical protein [Bacteroidaceae bacterium]